MACEDAKHALTPKLRFPEFHEDEGWEPMPIGDKVDLLSGYPFDGADISEDNSGVRLLRGINITEGTIRHSHEIDRYFLGAASAISKFELTENDLVIGMDGSKVGKNSALISSEDAGSLLIQRVARLRAIDSNVIRFIFLHINSSRFHRYVDKINTSSGIPHISAKQINEFTICFPSAAEQRKIGDCLTSLDEVIAAQGRKVEALKAHKIGLMQRLFPREGETLPRLRFAEFRDKPEWSVRELGPMTTKIGSGITPTGGSATYKTSGRPFIRSQNVGWGELILDDVAFIDEETHRSFEGTELQPLDVLLNITGASIGRSAVADARVVGGNVNQHVCVIRSRREDLDPVLLNQFLISEYGQKQIDSFQAGGNRQGLNFGQIRTFEIPLPPAEKEQQRIAACLSSLDARVAAEAEKLDGLKTHKKGLMQQLFPSAEGD